MTGATGFHVDWYAGASVELELFTGRAAGGRAKRNYQLKYTPPFRYTIRPPIQELPFGRATLDPITQQLDQLAATLDLGVSRQPGTGHPGPTDPKPEDQMKMLGNQLLTLLTSRDIQRELNSNGLFLEIGMDEALLEYPWELMHDGQDFLCLKHFVGRFVNASSQPILGMARQPVRVGAETKELSILVICVAAPRPRSEDDHYARLTEAEAETKAIIDTLNGIEGLRLHLIEGKDATYNAVYSALKGGGYDIIHFSGHAYYNDIDPKLSGIALYDRNMNAGEFAKYISDPAPVLCFMNACETGRIRSAPRARKEWKNRYDIFGLARTLLDAGCYLIGSRWKLGDEAAAAFAAEFYSSLIKGEKSLGQAVTEARKACRSASQDDKFSWASYVFYGDPRLCFRR